MRSAAICVLAAIVLGSAGCAAPDGDEEVSAPSPGGDTLEHVHGLGVDPADGTLYAASHVGVFRIDDDGSATRVADRWQDTMAFTVAGPGTFLASGHPDLREDLPPHLGLIESTDAAQTWRPLSLAGEADFHALEIADGRIYGFDAVTSQLIYSDDRRSWEQVAESAVVDLAWLGADRDRILATTPRGEVVEYRTVGAPTRVESAPPVVLIDVPVAGELVGVTAEGQLWWTDSLRGRWRPAGEVSGTPEAFEATPGAWYVATSEGIFSSDDRGATWELLVALHGHS